MDGCDTTPTASILGLKILNPTTLKLKALIHKHPTGTTMIESIVARVAF